MPKTRHVVDLWVGPLRNVISFREPLKPLPYWIVLVLLFKCFGVLGFLKKPSSPGDLGLLNFSFGVVGSLAILLVPVFTSRRLADIPLSKWWVAPVWIASLCIVVGQWSLFPLSDKLVDRLIASLIIAALPTLSVAVLLPSAIFLPRETDSAVKPHGRKPVGIGNRAPSAEKPAVAEPTRIEGP